MSVSRVQRIKQIARAIRYRELTACLGKMVTIHGLDTIEADLIHQLGSLLLDKFRMQPKEQKYFELGIAKYGILDVDFVASDARLEADYQSGIQLLKEVKFFPNMPSPDDDAESYNDAIEFSKIVLQDMIEELSLSQIHMRLFLEMSVKRNLKLMLESDFFPATFVVQDACLTNAPSIWVNKHFYL